MQVQSRLLRSSQTRYRTVLVLFLQKVVLLKYLNYQHAQIVIGVREIFRALLLAVLYFSFYIYTSGYCYKPVYPIYRGTKFLNTYKTLSSSGCMEQENVSDFAALIHSLKTVLCCHANKATLKPPFGFRRYG